MPTSVVLAVGAGVMSGISITAAGTLAFSFSWTAFASSLIMSGISKMMSKKPKMDVGSQADAAGRNVTMRQPVPPAQIIFGEVRTGGDITFMHTTPGTDLITETNPDNANKIMHLVVTFSGHVVDEFIDLYFNDELVEINHDTGLVTGKFAEFTEVYFSLGDEGDDQPFPRLVEQCPDKWTEEFHLQRWHSKVYIRIKYNQDVFPSGLPNVSATVRGYKGAKDFRTGVSRWTHNPAVLMSGYLMDTEFGIAAEEERFAEAELVSSSSICDERVRLTPAFAMMKAPVANRLKFTGAQRRPVTGDGIRFTDLAPAPEGVELGVTYYVRRQRNEQYSLHATFDDSMDGENEVEFDVLTETDFQIQYWDEPRYTANGTFRVSETPRAIVGKLLPSFAAESVNVGGKWFIMAGGYEAPTVAPLDENDLAGPIQTQSLVTRQDNCNGVKGTFVDPSASWQPIDFPAVISDAFKEQDNGEEILRDVDLTPFTISGSMAQRIAKIGLMDTRQGLTAVMPCKLSAYRAMTGKNIGVNNTKFGWDNKIFRVKNSRFTVDQEGKLGVELSLKETGPVIWDWNADEESLIDPTPNTNLPRVPQVTVLPENYITMYHLAPNSVGPDQIIDGAIVRPDQIAADVIDLLHLQAPVLGPIQRIIDNSAQLDVILAPENVSLPTSVLNEQVQAAAEAALSLLERADTNHDRIAYAEYVLNAVTVVDPSTGRVQLKATAEITTDVEARLTAVEISMSAVEATILLHSGSLTDLDGRVTSNEASIVILEDQVTTFVSSAYVDAAVDDAFAGLDPEVFNIASGTMAETLMEQLITHDRTRTLAQRSNSRAAAAERTLEAHADAISASAVDRVVLAAKVDANYATLVNELSVQAGLISAESQARLSLSSRVDSVEATSSSNAAALLNFYTKSAVDAAFASQTTTITAAYGAADTATYNAARTYAEAYVQGYTYSTASANSAIASAVSVVSARLDSGDFAAVKTSATASATRLNGIEARYSLTVTAGGRVSGMQLLSGSGSPSSITFLSDKFFVMKPDETGTAKAVFSIGDIGGVAAVGIAANMYIDGTITAAKLSVTQLSAITSNLGAMTGGSLNINNLFIVASNGVTTIRSATSGARLEIAGDAIKVFDASGVKRVQLGNLLS